MTDNPLAQVLAVHDGRAVLAVAPGVPCARCASGRGCGAGLLWTGDRLREIEVPIASGLNLRAGDQVKLAVPAAELLRCAVYAYGIPLAGMVTALALARLQGPLTDLVAVLVAAAGLTGAWLLGRLMLRRYGCGLRLQPKIIASGS